jgi:Lon protease-like protein
VEPRDLAPALDALPLFPLPTVLFPNALMPLHVFEPRYRKMVRDCLDTHRVMAVVLVTDPAELDAYGHPRIAEVACAGVIVDHTELSDGRFGIMLRGRARVRLRELPFVAPYRRAAATVIDPDAGPVAETDMAAMVAAAKTLVARLRGDAETMPFPKDADAPTIADLCAHYLVLDAGERQAVLETLDAGARVRRITEVLTLQRLALVRDKRTLN